MKFRFLDCRKKVSPSIRAITANSAARSSSTAGLQTATGLFKSPFIAGLRIIKVQARPYDELQTIVAAMVHPSDSLTRAIPADHAETNQHQDQQNERQRKNSVRNLVVAENEGRCGEAQRGPGQQEQPDGRHYLRHPILTGR